MQCPRGITQASRNLSALPFISSASRAKLSFCCVALVEDSFPILSPGLREMSEVQWIQPSFFFLFGVNNSVLAVFPGNLLQ